MILQLTVTICCKHYEEYRHCIFVNNEQRNKVIEDVKNKWSNGQKMGEYYVCMNCGEIIDTLKYSEFEGFGKENKIINVREAVVNEPHVLRYQLKYLI